ncbi:MAG: hypothetical protein PGN33_08465, partial [Methylobacterium radiotolerans]
TAENCTAAEVKDRSRARTAPAIGEPSRRRSRGTAIAHGASSVNGSRGRPAKWRRDFGAASGSAQARQENLPRSRQIFRRAAPARDEKIESFSVDFRVLKDENALAV